MTPPKIPYVYLMTTPNGSKVWRAVKRHKGKRVFLGHFPPTERGHQLAANAVAEFLKSNPLNHN